MDALELDEEKMKERLKEDTKKRETKSENGLLKQ